MVSRKLPSDLEEEILFRVPPRSLLRFRSVCKEWNTLLNDKRLLKRNFACAPPEFMLKTHTHIYSISVDLNEDPTIKVIDLCIDLRRHRYHYLYGPCDGYFFSYDPQKDGAVWNPLLRQQTKWVDMNGIITGSNIGYDGSRPEKSFKIFGRYYSTKSIHNRIAVFDFATNTWKDTHRTSFGKDLASSESVRVSLNGNLYWTGQNYLETDQYYFIQMFDFSKEVNKTFCILPCKKEKNCFRNPALSIYKGDRFSVLQQCKRTNEVKIWVTEKKIGNGDDGDSVVWIKFLTVSRPDFPIVFNQIYTRYFVDSNIYGKSFITCCHSQEPKDAWVYIVREDMCKKIKIDEVVCPQFQSDVYVPSLIAIS